MCTGIGGAGLEAVNLDFILLHNLFLDQELGNLLTLIAAQLDNAAKLIVVHDGAVASKFLLEHLQYLFVIILAGKTLERSERFSTVSLLNAQIWMGHLSNSAITQL